MDSDIPDVVLAELENIDSIVDGLNLPIDDGIKLLVAALHCHGFHTYGSCYGHLDRGTTGPYVCINDPNSDVLIGKCPRKGQAFMDCRDKVIRVNYLHRIRLYKLIEEFYKTRKYFFIAGLVLKNQGPGSTRLHCQMHEVVAKPEMSKLYPSWLENAQYEMDDFAYFLCDKLKASLGD